jgi:hypothetical protein
MQTRDPLQTPTSPVDVVNMDKFDAEVLVTATAQAPVCFGVETMSPH